MDLSSDCSSPNSSWSRNLGIFRGLLLQLSQNIGSKSQTSFHKKVDASTNKGRSNNRYRQRADAIAENEGGDLMQMIESRNENQGP